LEFEDVVDFRMRIAETIKKQKEREIPQMRDRLINNELAARVQIEGEPPAELVSANEQSIYRDFFASLQRQGMTFDAFLANSNITSEQFRNDAHRQALELTIQELAFDALARHLKLVVTDEEIVEEFEKSGALDPAALLKQWKDNGRLSEVREQILRYKAAERAQQDAEVFEPGKKPTKPAKTAKSAKPEKSEKPAKTTQTKKPEKAKKSSSEKTSSQKTSEEEVPTEKKTAAKKAPAEKKASAQKKTSVKKEPKDEKK
jgi:trigger factor